MNNYASAQDMLANTSIQNEILKFFFFLICQAQWVDTTHMCASISYHGKINTTVLRDWPEDSKPISTDTMIV